jgi:hypothetical protein
MDLIYTIQIACKKSVLLFLTVFFVAGSSLHAQQCNNEVYYYMWAVSNYSCSGGPVTVRAEMVYCEPAITSGEYHWYETETSTEPVAYGFYNGPGSYSDYTFDAYEGKEVWVSVYSYATFCETRREKYTVVYQNPAPAVTIQYAKSCGDGTAQIQATLTGQSVWMALYKYVDWSLEFIQYDNSGFFQIDNYNPEDVYVIMIIAYNGVCGGGVTIPVNFDVMDGTPPVIQGNLSVCEGLPAQLQAVGPQPRMLWYDAGGNFIYEHSSFPVPTNVAPGNYNYSVRGANAANCVTSAVHLQ